MKVKILESKWVPEIGQLVQVGQEVSLPFDKCPSWAEQIDKPKPKPRKPRVKKEADDGGGQ